jgi:hypothetical protein
MSAYSGRQRQFASLIFFVPANVRVNVRCEGPLGLGDVAISEDNWALRVFLIEN